LRGHYFPIAAGVQPLESGVDRESMQLEIAVTSGSGFRDQFSWVRDNSERY
jgi:hypothetical protein